MLSAPTPHDEAERLQDLHGYEILDTDPEESFDDLVALAAAICDTPMARINFIDADRQWGKASLGMAGGSDPREVGFCPHTIVEPGGMLVVGDTHDDARFAGNPNVTGEPHVRFYAGAAFAHGASGRPLGALCVIDTVPRELEERQRDALRRLARMVTAQLELRRLLTQERRLVDDLRALDREKAAFTALVAHDFRSPLTSIDGYADLLAEGDIDEERALGAIKRASSRLLRLVDDLTGTVSDLAHDRVDLIQLADAAADQARPAAASARVEVRVEGEPVYVKGDAHRLAQVLDNLVGNAIKYSPGGKVRIAVRRDDGAAKVEVADTGVGIPAAELPRLFDRFYRATTGRQFAGTGLGLATAKTFVEAHGGKIDVSSTPGSGTTFVVRLPVDP